MSDRSPAESVGSIRPLRPAEDPPVRHAEEMRRIVDADIAARLDLLEVRPAESFRPIAAPLLVEPVDVALAQAKETVRPTEFERPGPARTGEGPPATPTTDPVGPAHVPRRDWLLDPEPQTTPAEAQPYGDDPVRLRELVQWFADGRAATAIVQAPRAAGDLVDAVPDVWERPLRLRTVLAGERIR